MLIKWIDGREPTELVYLRGADLRGADLRGADLRGAYLSVADLSGADLSVADLRGAYLSGADLSGAYLSVADLRGADLRGAYLSGADLSGAKNILRLGPLSNGHEAFAVRGEKLMIKVGCQWGDVKHFQPLANTVEFQTFLAIAEAWGKEFK